MSCEQKANQSAQAAKRSGIPATGSKSGYLGRGVQVSFFEVSGPSVQASFFAGQAEQTDWGVLPKESEVNLSNRFTQKELQQISIQLRLGAAAVERHLRQLRGKMPHSRDQRDPRPPDWARADRKEFRFLVDQLAEARRGRGALDLSSLKSKDIINLWEFSRYEADRSLRNIDHFSQPSGSISGPTAAYLADSHKLMAHFYTHLADHLEMMIPLETIEAAKAWQ